MLEFEVKIINNIFIDNKILQNYYYYVKKNFQNLKWNTANVDHKTHQVKDLYGWAIQSNLKDVNKPCPIYNIKHDDDVIGTFNNSTKLVFGLTEKILQKFPYIRQMVISVHPPATKIDLHEDNDEFIKVHIPIFTNNDAYFIINENRYNLLEQNIYLINTSLPHGTLNLGNSDRVHLIFKIPVSYVQTFLHTNLKI